MVSSLVTFVAIVILRRNGWEISSNVALLATVVVTTICWVFTAYFGPQTERATLISFYHKVKPSGPGWNRVREFAGESTADQKGKGDNLPLALLGWVTGCVVVWSALFTVGNMLYGRWPYALGLLAIFLANGAVLISVFRKLWRPQNPSSQS